MSLRVSALIVEIFKTLTFRLLAADGDGEGREVESGDVGRMAAGGADGARGPRETAGVESRRDGPERTRGPAIERIGLGAPIAGERAPVRRTDVSRQHERARAGATRQGPAPAFGGSHP